MTTPRRCAPPIRASRGFTLLEVLISLLVFSAGLLVLADALLKTTPALVQHERVIQAQTVAQSYWALAQTQPLPPTPFDTSTGAPPAAYTPWFRAATAVLPGLVAVVTTPSAQGVSCTATACTLDMTLSWQSSGLNRKQSYVFQFGG